MDDNRQTFADQGYLLIKGALPADLCARLAGAACHEHDRLVTAGWRFAESGRLSGHLNFRMGTQGRALLEAFEATGLPALLGALAGEPVRLSQAVGNLNLPGSIAQDYHMDGAFDRPVMIANVCLVPTGAHNGATALVPASNRAPLSYWRFVRDGWRARAVRPELDPGDVLLRPSNLWHAGTPNRSAAARPMAAFAFTPERFLGPDDRCPDLEGPLTIFANKYYGRWRRAKEFAAVRLPRLDEAVRLGRSLAGRG